MPNLTNTNGINPSGSDSDAARITAFMQPGTNNYLGGGIFRVKGPASSILFQNSGTHVTGMGPLATIIEVDDTDGAVVDAIKVVTGVTDCSLKNLTIRPAGANRRTAGRYLSVNGAGSIIGTPATERLSNILVEDVRFERGYDGWAVLDGAGSKGSWGVRFSRCDYIDFNTGGTVRLIDTFYGGQVFEEQSMMYALDFTISGVRPAYALRIRNCADASFDTVNTVASTRGLVVDPAVGGNIGVLLFENCEFDSTNEEAILATNANGGQVLKLVFANQWAAPQDAAKIACSLVGVQHAQFNGGQFGLGAVGIKASGCTGVHAVNVDVSQSSDAGIWMTGSSTKFKLTDNLCIPFAGITPARGVRLDNGCNSFSVTGNVLTGCTNPIEDNTPGPSAGLRIIQDNVIL